MKTSKILIIIGVIFLLIILLQKGAVIEERPLVEIGGYYDVNRNKISSPLSVIDGVGEVKFIALRINVKNVDTVPLTFYIQSLTPQEIDLAKPLGKITIQPNNIEPFLTGLIDIEPYEGSTKRICVNVVSEKIPSSRKSSNKSGCIDISVQENPSGAFDVDIITQINLTAELTIHVADSLTANPVKDAVVTIYPESILNPAISTKLTDINGDAIFRGVERRKYEVVVVAAGYDTSTANVTIADFSAFLRLSFALKRTT